MHRGIAIASLFFVIFVFNTSLPWTDGNSKVFTNWKTLFRKDWFGTLFRTPETTYNQTSFWSDFVLNDVTLALWFSLKYTRDFTMEEHNSWCLANICGLNSFIQSCAHSSEISWANKGPLSFVNYVVIYKAQLTQNLLSNQATVPIPKSVGNVFALAEMAWIPIKITWFSPWKFADQWLWYKWYQNRNSHNQQFYMKLKDLPRFHNSFTLVPWLCDEQQKAAWFERDFCVSRASYIASLLTMDHFPATFWK